MDCDTYLQLPVLFLKIKQLLMCNMARNKGPNSTRQRRNPRYNSLSRAQRIRRAKEKETLLKLHNKQQVIDESLQNCPEDVHGKNVLSVSKTEILKLSEESSKLSASLPSTTVVNSVPVTKTGIFGPTKQNRDKLLIHGSKSSDVANSCWPRCYPTHKPKAKLFRHAKEKALWKLYSKQITDKSFQDCSKEVTSIDSEPTESRAILNPSEENSKLPDYLPYTTVVNSIPVTETAILGPSKQNRKKLLSQGIFRNKSSGIANRCSPRSHKTRKSKAQRLRRAKEKESVMKLCGEQIIDESFQGCSQEETSIDSMPTRNREILNPSEENEKNSDFSKNVTTIDSVSVIKTEILDPPEDNHGLVVQDYSQYATTMDFMPVIKTEIIDPPEENHGLVFQNYSQYAATMGFMPVIKTEILDLNKTNQKLLLPNIQVEQTQTNNAMDKPSRTEGPFASIINNKNFLKIKDILKTYAKVHLRRGSESPFLPHLPGSYKKSASPKKKKKPGKKKVRSGLSKTVCGCFRKVAMRKQLCENYLQLLQQDDANQLCLCKALPTVQSIKPDEKVMKKFYLEYPDFGKITCNRTGCLPVTKN